MFLKVTLINILFSHLLFATVISIISKMFNHVSLQYTICRCSFVQVCLSFWNVLNMTIPLYKNIACYHYVSDYYWICLCRYIFSNCVHCHVVSSLSLRWVSSINTFIVIIIVFWLYSTPTFMVSYSIIGLS